MNQELFIFGGDKMELIRFETEKLLEILKNKNEVNKEVTLIGKYVKSNQETKFILGYLEDIDMSAITLIKGRENYVELEKNNIYKITGKLKTYPDKYSNRLKIYIQIEVNRIEKIEEINYPDEIKDILARKEKLLNRKKADILDKINNRIKAGKKLNFLYIVSEKYITNDGEKDILNDLYCRKWDKNKLQDQFGIDFDEEKTIIRTKFIKDEFLKKQGTLSKIDEKIKNNNFNGVVFVKGGGSDLRLFDNIEFCEEIAKLNIPFITAVGHTDDNELLLSQMADKNYSTPTRLGMDFISISNKIYFANQKEIEKNIINEKINLQEEEIKNLEKAKVKIKEDKEEAENKLKKAKKTNIILLFIIILLIGYHIFSVFYIKNTDNLKEKVVKIEEVKKEEQNSNKNEKKIKTKNKKLVYSEDEIYTVLLSKGYRGEKAISNFQRANGMRVTGKVDEKLLKKLNIKIEYK